MKILKYFIVFVVLFSSLISRADEGMWIPLLLEKYNFADMQKKGFKLTAEDVYSINKASLKDAIVIFGRGCTGELISDEGLIITNHHCGYGQIQKHSTVEKDYLTDGFWAMSRKDELSNPGLTVQFLVRMEDVTVKTLEGVTNEMDEAARAAMIRQNASVISKAVTEGTHYKALIRPFYYGNQYYMFVYEEFRDVRLVGAPPSSIGKFGGDTDNWMWPRHTGDFSLFRIYADKDNKPADYSLDNVPYKPKKSLAISLKGVKKGDFTMVFGYPGRTQQFLTSHAVELISQVENPHMIAIRRIILDIMGEDMDASDKVRIQYSSKYAGIANYWKKWLGENKGLQKLNAIQKKRALELKFREWALSSNERKIKYGNLLEDFDKIYKEITPYSLAKDYIFEAFFGIDINDYIKDIDNLLGAEKPPTEAELATSLEKLKIVTTNFFKDYNLSTDKKIFIAMLKSYRENAGAEFQPEVLKIIDKKFKGSIEKFADHIYSKSVFVDEKKALEFLSDYNASKRKKLMKDPMLEMYRSFMDVYEYISLKSSGMNVRLDKLYRDYVAGLMEFQKDKIFYPDANFTMRITYGQVNDYEPMDGVFYNYFTSLDGIIAKDDPAIYDYKVPAKLKELFQRKDYGRYAENGTMKVAFIGSNHTTGGNSGSPVLNANGELVGINFDRNWEGTMSDIMYDPNQCRNITLDIRYALFIIDKFAGAGHLLNEMKIVE
ncbi:MAG: peptidase S46 [Bacteroidetes bacterium RIFOXYA12_FULL_35_11]|nr:MAG: peptidase S46 [Bacteroidetes bacterium GWF2_35_48]OFY73659.1 MAG: peptidase S46 [Bacteroidetes bacterium RIFOXYA12_FULL_35_11]HBX51188.1 serine protease [Bacteroidales bacterium]